MSLPSVLGAVVIAEFPEASPTGREQTGIRPSVIVGAPDFVGSPIYPGLIVVPCTSNLNKFADHPAALYPRLRAGCGGLTVESVVLLDQVRYIGRDRLRKAIGRLTPEEYEPIRLGLFKMFGF